MTARVPQLGDGDLAEHGVPPKAALLDRAAASGIAVPRGFVVLDGTLPAVSDTIVESLRADDAPLAVRSAFGLEDGEEHSRAGAFRSELGIAPTVDEVAGAVERVRQSGPADIRRDVLVMRQVPARHAGVAFTQATFEDDLVDFVDGLADGLLGGAVAGRRTTLPKLRRFERASVEREPWQRRLARLLRDVRRTFGSADWDVEWADDGAACWLVQVRPITVAPIRDEVFTLANHKEILPELPSTYMTSVIESASRDLLEFYRHADPALPLDREFVETFSGRPYLNLSMLTDLMRALGLPTRLVTESYGGRPDVDVGVRPLRLAGKARTLIRIGASQMTAVRRASAIGDAIEEEATRPVATFAQAATSFRECYVLLVNEMGALASSLALPVAALRRLGALDAHLAHHRSAATRLLDDLRPLAALVATDPAIAAEVRGGRVPDDPRFRAAWSTWVDRHGHRGVFESDIARPRFAEDPAPILAALTVGTDHSSAVATPAGGVGRWLTLPLWWVLRGPLAARERLRWRAMRSFAAYRAATLRLADRAVSAGQLPAAHDVWLLTIAELVGLDDGAVVDEAVIDDRRAERTRLAALPMPDELRRSDPRPVVADGLARSELHGIPLVRGEVTGRVLRAIEPPLRLPHGFRPDSTVLVARSVDAGWTPIFEQVAAVVVEIGGDLSHGSIILRELGIPSVTNVGEIGNSFEGVETVTVDGSSGRVELRRAV